MMKEKYLKLDELKQQSNDQLVTVKNDIVDIDYELKKINEDIKVGAHNWKDHAEF